jgi:hypothetical protein
MRTPLAAALACAALTLAVPAGAQVEVEEAAVPLRCGTGAHAGEALGFVGFPQGNVFCPLLADPKQVGSFLSWLAGEFPSNPHSPDSIGSIGVGDGFAFFRLGGPGYGDGLQLGLEAAIFAQFDLNTPSADLVNADYVVGLPLTFRRGPFSARARVYHQSSHLGDEYLLDSTDVHRENVSFESVELILSGDAGPVRVYAGGEWLFARSPDTLDPYVVHGGAELRYGPLSGARLVAAGDVKAGVQQGVWTRPGVSARAGVEIASWRSPEHPPRLWSVLAEYYLGPSPYGQFFLSNVRFAGLGFHFQL